ncbi:Transposon Ty3-I Gag-Pol polyprotein [Sesbania bispinosa]|nr:Transposon Ty3-I Gag-Pol polyprotein [Sesbania bispinosa]
MEKVIVDVDTGKFTVSTQDDKETFNVFRTSSQQKEPPDCLQIDSTEGVLFSNTITPLQGVKREEADNQSNHRLRKKKIRILDKKLKKEESSC